MKPKPVAMLLVLGVGLCLFGGLYVLVEAIYSPIPWRYGICKENGTYYAFPRGGRPETVKKARHEIPRDVFERKETATLVYALTFVPGFLLACAGLFLYIVKGLSGEQGNRACVSSASPPLAIPPLPTERGPSPSESGHAPLMGTYPRYVYWLMPALLYAVGLQGMYFAFHGWGWGWFMGISYGILFPAAVATGFPLIRHNLRTFSVTTPPPIPGEGFYPGRILSKTKMNAFFELTDPYLRYLCQKYGWFRFFFFLAIEGMMALWIADGIIFYCIGPKPW